MISKKVAFSLEYISFLKKKKKKKQFPATPPPKHMQTLLFYRL